MTHTTLTPNHEPTLDAVAWVEKLAAALSSDTPTQAAQLFEKDGYWRDLVAFTWNIKTLAGRSAISDMIAATMATVAPSNWRVEQDATETDGVVEAWVSFDTKEATGRGYLRLRDGLAWTFLTTMTELKNYPEKRNKLRPKGAEHGANKNRQTWLEKRQHEQATLGYSEQPYCVIIGGGQGGIGLGARLRQLEVPTIIIDALPKPGDTWRNRYKSLSLHDPIWYDHMPYIPFPENWPVFTPRIRSVTG